MSWPAIAIVAHTSRIARAVPLAFQLAGDDWPGPPIALDDGTWGSNPNHARAWRMALEVARDNGNEWVGVVEDDAIPIAGITAQLPAMLAAAPTSIVSAYLGTSYPEAAQQDVRRALDADPTWLVSTHLLHHVAVFARVPEAEAIADHLMGPHVVGCDTAIGILARARRWPVSYPVPSLFDHADDAPVIDVAERSPWWSPSARVAWSTGSRDDWTSGLVYALDGATERYYPRFSRGGG